ncbi:hypothetical protein J4427_00745 [Candidatus Woesearchaeota archaeon]|nr:hypothetical protein [Candidatus Woesearchaeota archaeon]
MAKMVKKHKKLHIKKRVQRKEREEIPKITLSKQALTDLITELVGASALPVVEQLQKRRNVSEFTIAEKLKLSINQFRHLIYKLDTFNLVSSTRRKDKQKGWYVYYWTFHPERLEKLYWDLKRRKLARLKKRIGTEQITSFYVCPNKDVRVPLTEAMELNFRCPECGKLLQEDKINLVKKLGSEIEEIEKELKEHSQESK